jgi:hypothetical protein
LTVDFLAVDFFGAAFLAADFFFTATLISLSYSRVNKVFANSPWNIGEV